MWQFGCRPCMQMSFGRPTQFMQFGLPMGGYYNPQALALQQANIFTGLSLSNPGFIYPAMYASQRADYIGALMTNRYWAGSNGQFYAFDPDVPQNIADAARGFGTNPLTTLQQGFQYSLARGTMGLIYNTTTRGIATRTKCFHTAVDAAFKKDDKGIVTTELEDKFKAKLSADEQIELIELMTRVKEIEKRTQELCAGQVSDANAKELDNLLGEVQGMFDKKDSDEYKIMKRLMEVAEEIDRERQDSPTTNATEETETDTDTDNTEVTDDRNSNSRLTENVQEDAAQLLLTKEDNPAANEMYKNAANLIATIANLEGDNKLTPFIQRTPPTGYKKRIDVKMEDGKFISVLIKNNDDIEIHVNYNTTYSRAKDNSYKDISDVKYVIAENGKSYAMADTDLNHPELENNSKVDLGTQQTNALITFISKIFGNDVFNTTT